MGEHRASYRPRRVRDREGDGITGVLATRPGWVEQLYVRPASQGRGLGRALLDRAKAHSDGQLQLWVFTRNTRARCFYGRAGFTVAEETDGAGNEEHQPTRATTGSAPRVRDRPSQRVGGGQDSRDRAAAGWTLSRCDRGPPSPRHLARRPDRLGSPGDDLARASRSSTPRRARHLDLEDIPAVVVARIPVHALGDVVAFPTTVRALSVLQARSLSGRQAERVR